MDGIEKGTVIMKASFRAISALMNSSASVSEHFLRIDGVPFLGNILRNYINYDE